MTRTQKAVVIAAACSLAILILSASGLVVLRLFYFKHYRIMQNGMFPAIPKGRLIISRQHPYDSPADVRRGHVVVFLRHQKGKSFVYVWRVVGLPGERIVLLEDGSVSVNGQPLARRLHEETADQVLLEEQANGIHYLVAYAKAPERERLPVDVLLGEDEFFVLGDNRDFAFDSQEFGPIRFDTIIGRQVL